jgi:hypothetical protein
MVASFVFFYCCRTTWTFLSVRSDPHSVGYVLTGLREEMKEKRRKERRGGKRQRKGQRIQGTYAGGVREILGGWRVPGRWMRRERSRMR